MRKRVGLALLAAATLQAGCGTQEGRGGLTAEEERQLDEAARMLDDNMIEVSPDGFVGNEAQAEAEAMAADAAADPAANGR
ncbi:MAG TPA: hypothetical protein VN231_12880 [Allosphingosinicella sp.]|nr:hypothetical protein [Allosphingosinicella sp.]